jgi:hypothetical protein
LGRGKAVGTRERRPVWGAAASKYVSLATMRATINCRPDRSGLAWHASRGWSRVGTRLPCSDVLAVRVPFLRRKPLAAKPLGVINS